ncbi:MAG: hypothetical protein AB1446_09150 [Bacillota bacterium]
MTLRKLPSRPRAARASVPQAVLVAGLVGLAVATLAAAGAVLTVCTGAALAQAGNELCLGCHGQQGLTTFDGDKEVDLYVDPQKYASSPHGKESCTSCHPQFQGFDHGRVALGEELRLLTLQACVSCHEGYDFGEGKVSCHPDPLTCEKCHGPIHEVMPRGDPASPISRANAVGFCASCHEKEETSYYYSFHGSAYRLGSRQAPLCTDCHGHLSPVNGNVEEATLMCGSCHRGSPAAMANLLRGKEHVTPQDRENGFPLWVVWKFFLAVILLNTAKDGSLAILDLTRRLRVRSRSGPEGGDGHA